MIDKINRLIVRPLAAAAMAVLCVENSVAVIIVPGATDNAIAFEAEIGDIDNSYQGGTPGTDPNGVLGWEADIVTTPPAGASGGSYLVNTEHTNDDTPPHNSLTFMINFQKTGIYNIYTRAAFSDDLYQHTGTAPGNSDSYLWDAGTLGDGIYAEINRAGEDWVDNGGVPEEDDISSTVWRWLGDATSSGDGPADLVIAAPGIAAFTIATREDGFMLDRLALIHEDETAPVSGAFFDGLANSAVVPEPTTMVLMSIASLALAFKGRAALRTVE